MRSLFDSVIRTFCWSMLLAIFGAMLMSCETATAFVPDDPDVSALSKEQSPSITFDEGGTVPVIQMPFAAGHVSQCTQGVNGVTSHHSSSTMYDIDFDTSNTSKEQLRAPVSGTAYVHMEDATKNFGYHLCIFIGNGMYVILGHMSDIAVKNGEHVDAGQFVGYEGCTGYCSGDHVHIGLHVGDAQKMGEFGASVPVRYMLSDKTMKTSVSVVDSSALVCGIKAFGDSVEGHKYISALPSVNAQAIASTTTSSTNTSTSSNTEADASSNTDASSGVDTTASVPSSQAADASMNKTSDPPPPPSKKTSTDDVWTNDLNLDGAQETLMMSATRWNDAALFEQDAFVWGTGGCFDQKLIETNRVHAENGYYQVDFTKIGKPCLGSLTLISAIGKDGKAPNADGSNWNWWQNASLCSKGSSFCDLQKNGQPWEEWLIRVSWDPYEGLMGFGNGYTKNSQLK